MMSLLFYVIMLAVAIGAAFFLPKWLFWITPHSNSAYDVLAGHRERMKADG